MLKQVQTTSAKVSGRQVHTVQKVLVEEVNSHDSRLLTGRLENNTVVHFPGEPQLIGTITQVFLDEFKGFYYMGTIVQDREER